ncbi:putative mitochondrial ribosomal protein [Malassezia pachydermatis]|uniref:Putative mitochondrial ribosomal protein n=1 Tax=Malassezia pachydermatis TaxID=77020 RepID=A0A0M9VQJ3_9BASI|nr:putative mitochondrial ribosomal protein [Malassezia pachydermatis]KOS15592.1 putative mitochondrial ribosomal protein [Malassezia pachydermatis]
MRMPLRALNSQASCYAAASSHAMTNATPSSSGPLGSNLEPSDILAFLNSPEFSSYQSASDAHGALLGDDATLAATALTHESWMHGVQGHNRRLAFIGRRALKTYMSLFLFDILAQATRSQASSADLTYLQNILATPHSVDQLVATHRLGDHVGRAMGLEKVMRWHPTVRLDGASGQQESGLFKVRGACVEAVLGAIYHYRGAQVAQQFFLARILPHLNMLHEQASDLVRSKISQASEEATQALSHAP